MQRIDWVSAVLSVVLLVPAMPIVSSAVETLEPSPGDEPQHLALLAAPQPALEPSEISLQAQAQLAESPAAVPQSSSAELAPFSLGPGDQLKVTVWGYPELSEQVAILPDGTVSYPLVGVMRASGLTAEEFGANMARALEGQLVQRPQISIVIEQMRSQQFSVLGDVRQAGVYPLWNHNVTVLEGIAQAGGMGNDAIPAEVKILRRSADGTRITIPVNFNALLDEPQALSAESMLLQAGDTIYVPSQQARRKICVLGEVHVPGMYTLSPNMTVIEALSAAGWAKKSGVLRSVMIVRRGGNEQEFFRIDANRVIKHQDFSSDIPLQPGDIVYVPQQFVSKIGDFVSFFSSKVEPAAHSYLRVYDATNPASYIVDR